MCFVFLTNDLINLNDTQDTTVFVYRQTWIILNLGVSFTFFSIWIIKLNYITYVHTSSVAPLRSRF